MTVNLTEEIVNAAQQEENSLLDEALNRARSEHLYMRVVNLNAQVRSLHEQIAVLSEALQEAAQYANPERAEGSHRASSDGHSIT